MTPGVSSIMVSTYPEPVSQWFSSEVEADMELLKEVYMYVCMHCMYVCMYACMYSHICGVDFILHVDDSWSALSSLGL